MKANLTRGNSVTESENDLQILENIIYKELLAEYYHQIEKWIKENNDRIVAEMMGPSKPMGYISLNGEIDIIGIRTDLDYNPFLNWNLPNA